MSPIPQTSNWSGTFFAVSYSKPALAVLCILKVGATVAWPSDFGDGKPENWAALTSDAF